MGYSTFLFTEKLGCHIIGMGVVVVQVYTSNRLVDSFLQMLNTYSVSNDLSDELAWRTNHTSVFSWILLCFFDYRRCCRLLM